MPVCSKPSQLCFHINLRGDYLCWIKENQSNKMLLNHQDAKG